MIRRRDDTRGAWYLLTGLLLGLVVGLGISWGLSPVRYVDTAPFSMSAEYKDQYRALIADAFQADGDLGRARSRLELLQDSDPMQALVAQAQRSVVSGGQAGEARSLAMLASALGQAPGQVVAFRGTPVSPTKTMILTLTASVAPSITNTPQPSVTATATATSTSAPTDPAATDTLTPTVDATLSTLTVAVTVSATVRTPVASRTATPSRTPTVTPGLPFVLAEQTKVCDPSIQTPQLQVQVVDGLGKPVSGIQAVVSWDGGQDAFFTGLKPEINPGYADFNMTTGVTYALRLVDGGEPVNNLAIVNCDNGGTGYAGGWLLKFKQP